MRKGILFIAAVAAVALALAGCQRGNGLQAPFEGAEWIGTSEKVLYADYLPMFTISADIEIAEGSQRASLLFGGNDPRLMSVDKNIMGVAAGQDESYMRVELDRKARVVRVYRTGYTQEDVPGRAFDAFDIPDSLLHKAVNRLSVTAALSRLIVSIDGAEVGESYVGTLGKGGDYIAFPQLSDVGWLTEYGQTARVSNIRIEEMFTPNALLWEHPGMAAAAADEMQLLEPSFGGMPLLRTSFDLKNKDIEQATLYATARGIYELCINGQRVGDGFYAPGCSQYNKHHYYQQYDVTDLLRQGGNTMTAQLAEGWWAGDITYMEQRNYFGDQLALLAALEVRYTDGTVKRVLTDPRSWEATTEGTVVYASLLQGQVTDATRTLENATWRKAEKMTLEGHLTDQTFGATAPRTDDYSHWQLLPQPDASPSCFEVLRAQSVSEVRPGVWIYDMGQNMAGIPRIAFSGLTEGQQLTVRYAEVLYPDMAEYKGNEGMPMLENIRSAMAQDIVIASAEDFVFEPRFTQHGYRYLELTGIDRALPLESVEGLVISSVQRITAHYECSNPLVNQLWSNIRRSMLGNFISIPTDCPQRNERMGWSGDLSVFSRTATYLSDVDAFLTRHTQAIRDVQMPDGRMPDVAPIGGAFGGILWGSVGITVPYECYRQYADTAILLENYDAMAAYMTLVDSAYIEPETDPEKPGSGLMTQGNRVFGGLGDWLGPQNSQIDNSAIWDAYYIFDLEIMQEVAHALGKADDEALYADRLAQRKAAYCERYFDPETGRFIASGYPRTEEGQVIDLQSCYVLPLAFGIIDDEALRAKVLGRLEQTLLHPGKSDNGIDCPPYSLMTGFITTAWISNALSLNGRSDLAYRLLQNTQYPGWLYPVTQGATSIWERLDSYTKERGFGGNNSMNSFNHYSFGAVGQWLMAWSLGIDRDPAQPGFRHFILHPVADPTGQMTWARGWYDTPYGRIESSWRRSGGKVEYEFTLPEGCSATLRLPGMDEVEISGSCRISR